MKRTEKLVNLVERLGRVVLNAGHTGGLKPVQWEVLRFLARANRFSRRPAAVTQFLGVTKGTVSQTLIALENKGLINRVPSGRDRRSKVLALTIEGRRMIEQDPTSQLLTAAENIPKSRLDETIATLETILEDTLRRGGGVPFGVCSTCRHFKRNATGGNPNLCALLKEPLSQEDAAQICMEFSDSSAADS